MLTASPPQTDAPKDPSGDLIKADLCIIGAGPAGIALAANAAACGQSVVLVEKHRMGGTSLNYGTVPSMALAAAGETAAAFRGSGAHGIKPLEPTVEWAHVGARIRDAVAGMAPNFSAERLGGLGVRVIHAAGRFADQKTLMAGEHRVEARRYVVATGSSPLLPNIRGVKDVAVFTTDTIFENREPVDHLIIIGAGASGTQLAQAFRRLGSRVTLIDQSQMLGRFDHELADVVRIALTAEGVVIYENARVDAVAGVGSRIAVEGLFNGEPARVEGSHVLIACGRRPAVADLGLDLAKVAVTAEGIKTDGRLRSTNRRVYAIGDATGHPQSVQRAEYHARLLSASLVLGKPRKLNANGVPIALYTDPELAMVGLTEAQSRKAFGRVEVHRFPMRENVRAMSMRAQLGHVKVTTDRRGRILGAGIAAKSAAELIQVWALAISKGLTLDDMSGWIAPHPTLGEINRNAAVHRYAEMTRFAAQRAWGRVLARLQ